MVREAIAEYPGRKILRLWLGLLVAAMSASSWAAVQDREIKPLPLDSFCNKVLVKSWAVVPQGLQRLDGVPFQINGYIELASSRASPRRVLPLEAAGVEVGKKFSRIHLLHCAEYYDRSGEPLADLVLYYANGERRVASLVYGVHAQDWYDYAGEGRGLVQDPNSRVAWKGTSDDAAQFGKIVRLYHTALDNPLPDQVVTRLDIISELSEANPMVFAISLEKEEVAPPAESPFQRELPSQFDVCKLSIVETNGEQPVPGARVKVTAKDGMSRLWLGDFVADKQGKVQMLSPRARFDSFAATVMAKGHKTATAALTASEPELLLKELTIKLDRGMEIGGKVVDDSERPIAGVAIRVRGMIRDPFGQFSLTDLDAVTTDVNGHWTSSGGGADLKGLIFSMSCVGFRNAEYEEGDESGPFVLTRGDLVAKSSVMKMERN
jgi:hypothetical protein